MFTHRFQMVSRYFWPISILLLLFCSCLHKVEVADDLEQAENACIGTKTFAWIDSSRLDPYYGRYRLINVQVWYPGVCVSVNKQRSPYYYKLNEVYEQLAWTPDDLEFLESIKTRSFSDIALNPTQSKLPLILFSPSLGGNLSHYSYYAEKLTEAGFVVIGINHLYESEYVIDNYGEVFLANHAFHDSLKSLSIPDQISAEDYRREKGERHKVLAEDLIFALNRFNQEAFFEGIVDVHKIGSFGHSIGGAAAMYASLMDIRFKGVLNLDGTPPTAALENDIATRFMFIEDLTDYRNHPGYAKMHRRRSNFCEKNSEDSWRILIADINHNSFLDSNFHFADQEVARESALRILRKTEKYMTNFFKYSLFDDELDIQETMSDTLEIHYFKRKT